MRCIFQLITEDWHRKLGREIVRLHQLTHSTMDCEVAGPDDGNSPASWEKTTDNVYLNERKSCKNGKRDNEMQCDCEMVFVDGQPVPGCGEDCINRLLMIECNPKLCPCGDFCQNQRFQKRQHANVETFQAGKKGWGLRAKKFIPEYTFILEYVGEVCSNQQFQKRSAQYHANGRRHHYFMTLRTDEIIDATVRGSISRFINHSCEPNCETQKWTVNGRLRIGFFSRVSVEQGEELTFDYQFQRSGEGAQPCYCGAASCRGIIGGKGETSEKVLGSAARSNAKKSRPAPEEDELTTEIKRLRRWSSVGVKDPSDILPLSRLMVTADRMEHRLLVLDALLATKDSSCLRMFMKLQGLSLLWSWMVDCEDDKTDPLASGILDVLAHLPVTNLNPLLDSKVFAQVKKWSTAQASVGVKATPLPSSSSDGAESLAVSPVKTVGEPSSLGSADVCADEAARHFTSEDESKTSSLSPLQSKRTPPMSDSGVGSPDPCDSGHGSLAGNGTDNLTPDKSPVRDAAMQLMEKWSVLKEIYRIPKKPIQPKPAKREEEEEEDRKKEPPAAPIQPRSQSQFSSSEQRYSLSRRGWSSGGLTPRRSRERDQFVARRRWDSAYGGQRSGPPKPQLNATAGRHQDVTTGVSAACGPHIPTSSSSSQMKYDNASQAVASPSMPIVAADSQIMFPQTSAYTSTTPGVLTGPDLLAYQSLYYQQQQQQLAASALLITPVALTSSRQPADETPTSPLSTQGAEEMNVDGASDGSCDVEASPVNLPSQWSYARDSEGRVYYYHIENREPQWEHPGEDCKPPLPDDCRRKDEPVPPVSNPSEQLTQRRLSADSCRSGSTLEVSSTKRHHSRDLESEGEGHPAKMASPAITIKHDRAHEVFRGDVSVVVIQLLNPYLKPDCKQGRIQNTTDFKYLARKLTHDIVQKEMKHRPESKLELTSVVREKITKFVRSCMKKCKDKYERPTM